MHTFWMVICSNSILAIGIAAAALLLGYVWKNPAALHLVWLVVLLKLFTPPIMACKHRRVNKLPFGIRHRR